MRHRHVGPPGADLATCVYSGGVGKLDVHDNQVGFVVGDAANRLFGCFCLTDDLEVRFGVEHRL